MGLMIEGNEGKVIDAALNTKLNRRDAGKAAAASCLALLTGGSCLTGAILDRVVVRLKERGRAQGSSEFSDAITVHNLEPHVFNPEDTAEVRLQAACGYLQRLSSALRTSEISLPKLQELRCDITSGYPIALIPDYTLADVLDIMATELTPANGKTILHYDESTTPNAAGWDPIAHTGNTLEFDKNGKLRRKTSITFRGHILTPDKHGDDNLPRAYTDLELAIILIHEYAHGSQGEMFFQGFLITDTAKDILSHTPIDIGTLNEHFFDYIQVESQRHQEDLMRQYIAGGGRDIEGTQVAFSEAQANALACGLLYCVNLLNEFKNGGHIPGSAHNLDPLPTSGAPLLYSIYLSRVLPFGPLDPGWIEFYRMSNKQ